MQKSRTPLTIGWQAVKVNMLPGFVLQATMLSIVLAHYFSPKSAALLNQLADYKRNHEVAFVIISSHSCRNYSSFAFFSAAGSARKIFAICSLPRRSGRLTASLSILCTEP